MEIQLSSLSLAYVEAQEWLNWKLLSNPKQGLSQVFKKTCLKRQSKNLRLSWLHNYWVIFKVLNGKVCFLEKFGKCKYDFTHKGAPPPLILCMNKYNHQGLKLFFFQGAQLHLQKLPQGFVYRNHSNQYVFGLPAEIWGSPRIPTPPPPPPPPLFRALYMVWFIQYYIKCAIFHKYYQGIWRVKQHSPAILKVILQRKAV